MIGARAVTTKSADSDPANIQIGTGAVLIHAVSIDGATAGVAVEISKTDGGTPVWRVAAGVADTNASIVFHRPLIVGPQAWLTSNADGFIRVTWEPA